MNTSMSPQALTPLQQKFLALIRRNHEGSRYWDAKFRCLKEDWPAIKRLAAGDVVLLWPRYVEIHVTERCQLACKFCRDGLRSVPEAEIAIDMPTLLETIDELGATKDVMRFRISGVIGDPLLHKDIRLLLERINHYRQFRFGLTTNGLGLMRPGIIDQLVRADYLHVSVDAGTDATYQSLKKGKPGDFNRVLEHIRAVITKRTAAASSLRVITSILLQSENLRELPALAAHLDAIGVDALEIKMQHFDARRCMTTADVDAAYALVRRLHDVYRGRHLSIVEVQNQSEALIKVLRHSATAPFRRCYANMLGLNATIDPRGSVQTCCQYFGSTLGAQADISTPGFPAAWFGSQRCDVLAQSPRERCGSCAPSDEYVNRFVETVRELYEADAKLLDWAEQVFFSADFGAAIVTHASAGAHSLV